MNFLSLLKSPSGYTKLKEMNVFSLKIYSLMKYLRTVAILHLPSIYTNTDFLGSIRADLESIGQISFGHLTFLRCENETGM